MGRQNKVKEIKNFQKREKPIQISLYVIIFSVYPIISLFASNIYEANKLQIIRPIIISVLLWETIYNFLFRMKDRNRAGNLTVFMLILFYGYGHFYNYVIVQFQIEQEGVRNTHFVLLLIFLLLYIGAVKLTKVRSLSGENLLFIGIVLMVIPTYQIGHYYFYDLTTDLNQQVEEQLIVSEDTELPDIYLIILDEYTRSDKLETRGFDNSEFVEFLMSQGFFVPECSISNYKRTLLSMSSLLNMDYLWNALPNGGRNDSNLNTLHYGIRNNRVRNALESIGYKSISFETGYFWLDWNEEVDIYMERERDLMFSNYFFPFEYQLIETTLVKAGIDLGFLSFLSKTEYKVMDHYLLTQYVLEKLPEVATLPGPKFVYAHILLPHGPRVFQLDGSLSPRQPGWDGYLNSVKFINSEVELIVKEIIEKSKSPPLILITGDHGSEYIDSKDARYATFSAYYLPNQEQDVLPPTISLVNSFRLIFDLYFESDFALLPDIAIDADHGRPFSQREVNLDNEQAECVTQTNQ